MVPADERFFSRVDLRCVTEQDFLIQWPELWWHTGLLMIRPLLAGVTRCRFSFRSRIRVPLSSVLPERGGAGRPGSILTQAIAGAWQSVKAIRAFRL